jgi:hypothetical protein
MRVRGNELRHSHWPAQVAPGRVEEMTWYHRLQIIYNCPN